MEPHSPVPLCLPSNFRWDPRKRIVDVDKGKPRGNITVCKEGLAILESVKDDYVVVICITGPARTGKSYFLSHIQEGITFELGHSTTSKTTGIWIALAPKSVIVHGISARLVLLDAEGLGSTSTIDHAGSTESWDRKVFTLCALFSSYLIYNSKGIPTSDDLDKLGFIAQFSSSINVHSPTTGGSAAVAADIAPYFMWLIRDALLQPEIDGVACSWKVFVKSSVLSVEAGAVKNRRNAIKTAISTSFRNFNAYGLPPPSDDPEVVQNLLLPKYQEKINKKFLTQIQEVKEQVLSYSEVKVIQGRRITGEELATYVASYVTMVNHEYDKLPPVHSAWDSFKNLKWNDILVDTKEQYDKSASKISFPVSNEAIKMFHADEVQKALNHLEASNFDETSTKRYRKELDLALKEKLRNIKDKNNTESRIYCENVAVKLEKLHFVTKVENIEKYSLADLVKAKKMVIEDYLLKAKGPIINHVRKEMEEKMDSKIKNLQPVLIQTTIENVGKLYEKEALGKIEDRFPLDAKELLVEHKRIRKLCVKQFKKKCSGYDKLESAFSSLDTYLRQRLLSLQKTNLSRSNSVCEEAMRASKRKYFDQQWNQASEMNISDLEAAKQRVLEEYEKDARGPAKDKIKIKCNGDIDDMLCRAKPLILQHALSEAEKEYKRKFDELLQDGTLDSDGATKKCESVCAKICRRFETRCEGADDSLSRIYNEKRSRIESEMVKSFHRRNGQLSSEYCEEVMTTLIRDILKPCMDRIDMVVSYDEKKELILKEYRIKAKGPNCDQILNEFVLQIDRDIERAKQQRVLKGIKITLDGVQMVGIVLAPLGGNAAKVGSAVSATAKVVQSVINNAK